MMRWQPFQARFHLKQKHQPVRPALETMFADQAVRFNLPGRQRKAGFFFMRFAAGADVGDSPDVHFQPFPPTIQTPQAKVWAPARASMQRALHRARRSIQAAWRLCRAKISGILFYWLADFAILNQEQPAEGVITTFVGILKGSRIPVMADPSNRNVLSKIASNECRDRERCRAYLSGGHWCGYLAHF